MQMDDTRDLENKSVVNFREEPFRHRRDKPNSLGEKRSRKEATNCFFRISNTTLCEMT